MIEEKLELPHKITYSIFVAIFVFMQYSGSTEEGKRGKCSWWDHLAGPRTSRLSSLRGVKLGWRAAEVARKLKHRQPFGTFFMCADTDASRENLAAVRVENFAVGRA